MKLALLQPCLIPDLYYIAAIKKADKVIISSDDNWSRKGRTNRFLVRTNSSLHWITWPILTEDKKKKISEVRLDHSDNQWLIKMLRTLEQAYRNSIYFDHYEPEIKADFEELRQFEYLIDAINYMNQKLWTYLEWSPESNKIIHLDNKLLGVNPKIVMDQLGASTIFMEENGSQFQWQTGLQIKSLETYPVYKQHFGGFLAPCSVLDVLFEVGPEWYRIYDAI
jgi:hypothetical protein